MAQKKQLTNTALLFSRMKSPTTSVTIKNYEKIFATQVKTHQIFVGATTAKDGYHLAPKLTEFDSIFANSDEIAASIWQWFDEHELPKPLIIGQERMLVGKLLHLPTVDNHYHQVGVHALELAISKKQTSFSIDSQFILRQ